MARGNRPSYFAEIRQSKTDPNYFNREDPDRIRQNVKRILKDVVNDNILDEDYIYFTNSNVLNACLIEAQEQFAINTVTSNALYYYKNSIMTKNLQPFWVNNPQETMIAANEHTKSTQRCNAWACAQDAFMQIQYGADPKMALMQLCRFRDDINRNI